MLLRGIFLLFATLLSLKAHSTLSCVDFLNGATSFRYAKGMYDYNGRSRDDFWYRLQGMHSCGGRIYTFMKAHKDLIRGPLLEVGPLYNPFAATLRPNKETPVVYWDKDQSALLGDFSNIPQDRGIHRLLVDLNALNDKLRSSFVEQNRRVLSETGHNSFGTVIISQVLKYLDDYAATLAMISRLQKSGDVLFSNEVLEPLNSRFIYGDALFVSPSRPSHPDQLVRTMEELGYEVLAREEQKVIAHDTPRVLFLFRKK